SSDLRCEVGIKIHLPMVESLATSRCQTTVWFQAVRILEMAMKSIAARQHLIAIGLGAFKCQSFDPKTTTTFFGFIICLFILGHIISILGFDLSLSFLGDSTRSCYTVLIVCGSFTACRLGPCGHVVSFRMIS